MNRHYDFQQAKEPVLAQRNLDYSVEKVLSNLKADIALYQESPNTGDLVDVLEEIRELLTRLLNAHPHVDRKF